jgi:hypothetical protein
MCHPLPVWNRDAVVQANLTVEKLLLSLLALAAGQALETKKGVSACGPLVWLDEGLGQAGSHLVKSGVGVRGEMLVIRLECTTRQFQAQF